MVIKKIVVSLAISLFLLSSCKVDNKTTEIENDSAVIETAAQQIGNQVRIIQNSGSFKNPRTVSNGFVQYVQLDDWTSGFFPGTMWKLYELTGDEKWKNLGINYTEQLDSVKYLTSHHDVGFMIMCSYGNAYRITKNKAYESVIIEAAKSLSTRFKPAAGVFQSWDENSGWQATKGWMCPVIIDNMMNLEVMFEATRLSGDSTFRAMAIEHANKTMENQFRKNYSCYHVVDYDKIKGGVRSKITAQGYANESSWARGQAWALYGFTVCYRETNDKRYLNLAENIYKFIFNNKNMPADLVPYWDYDAPNIPFEPRDASAAAITASALYELSTYGGEKYRITADKIVNTLSGDAYRAIIGTNGNFLLMHSVGSIPHNNEIDVPLNYADYYFLEALARKNGLEKNSYTK